MTRLNLIHDAFCRWTYLLSMYCGVRAVVNRLRGGVCSERFQVARFHRTLFFSEALGKLVVFVHPRPKPRSFSRDAVFGMISLQQQRPVVSRFLYRYFCLTSHFGCGHLEIAFYEKEGKVTFYSVRNVIRSNAARIGCSRIAQKLVVAQRHEEKAIIQEVARLLGENGLVTGLATAHECVDLSVRKRFLHPRLRQGTLRALKKKYEILQKATENGAA
jgi:hypothetical protein